MNNIHDILEICLQNLEQGSDLDTILVRYPGLADELYPLLETAVKAKSLSVPVPSMEIARRNRAKVLQRVAEMRATKTRSNSWRFWSASFRRIAVALVVITMLFTGGTSLVRAASTTLPGDNLYPVKRIWEDVLVLFTFDLQQREALEIEHENERMEELNELFMTGRFAQVEFSGLVTLQNGTEWLVSGIPVIISAQTTLPDQPIMIGSAIRVAGKTQNDRTVLAEHIELLPPGTKLLEEMDGEDHEESTQQIYETETPESTHETQDQSSKDGSDKGDNSDESEDDD